jgi:N6-adenosine-specific RNA methylase IME4
MHETALVHFDTARRELALASSLDEVKMLRDKAEALRQYVRQQGASLEMQNQCAEIKLRAERKAGEMLAERDTDLHPVSREHILPEGITHAQSHRWQLEASLPEDEFERHVAETKAEGQELTSASVLRLAARVQRQEAVKAVSTIEQNLDGATKYRCIVIDPPWPVQKIEREVRPNQGQALDYPIMTLDEIGALPILDQADPTGCHLYLWVTHKYLPVGLCLLERWGFDYQCVLTWVKNVGFTPYSWMYSTEHCLFAHVGNLSLLKLGLRLDFGGKVREHSRKPDEFYNLVRMASPWPRLDMFSRELHEGFEQWGNETDRFS